MVDRKVKRWLASTAGSWVQEDRAGCRLAALRLWGLAERWIARGSDPWDRAKRAERWELALERARYWGERRQEVRS